MWYGIFVGKGHGVPHLPSNLPQFWRERVRGTQYRNQSIPLSNRNFNLEIRPKIHDASAFSNMEVLPEEVAAQEMVVTQEEVVAQDMVVAQEKIVTQEMVVTQEKIVTQEMAVTQMEVVAQEEVVTQDEVPQAIGDTLIEDAPKLATITESPTKATGSLVDKVLWKGTPLKELTFESDAKQQQLLNTIHQLEKIDAVKTRFIYVSTFLTSMEVRSTTPPPS